MYFGSKPKKARPPLEESDHPELDTSELCNDEEIRQYQTLIGQLMWTVTLEGLALLHLSWLCPGSGKLPGYDISDRSKGSLDFGYLAKLSHGAIRYRFHEPDYSNLPHKQYDWARTVCNGAREQLPHDLPKPLGRQVTSTHYVDANLHHDLVTSKAVTAIL